MPAGMDFAADVNRVEFVRLARLYPLPDFVKHADLETTQQPRDVLVTVYADPVRKQFPCHSKAATWINALYFQEKKAEFHQKDQARIRERLDHYARYWGIKAAVDRIATRWTELHKDAEAHRPDSDFAYVWDADDGARERRLPITTRTQVKDAAEWLREYRDRIPFSDRNKIAGRILEKAARLGAHLGDAVEFLEKQAGRGVCDPAAVVSMIEGRALLAGDAPTRDTLRKLASAVRDTPRRALQPDQLVKLAHTMDMVDRGLGVVGKYTDALPRPEDVIFAATFAKSASDCQAVVATTSGRVWEKSALTKLALGELRDLFGDEFVGRVRTGLDLDPEKMAVELGALPRPDAQLVEAMLMNNGIAPVMQKAASARRGFDADQLRELARHYG